MAYATGAYATRAYASEAPVNALAFTELPVSLIPPPSSSSSPWNLYGDASYVGSSVQLTPNLGSKQGWVTTQNAYSGTRTFWFDMSLSGGGGSGADGFAFSLLDSAQNAVSTSYGLITPAQYSMQFSMLTYTNNSARIYSRPGTGGATLVNSASYSTARGSFTWKVVVTDTGSNTCSVSVYKAGALVVSATGVYLPPTYYVSLEAQTGGVSDLQVLSHFSTADLGYSDFMDNFADAQILSLATNIWNSSGYSSETGESTYAMTRGAWAKLVVPASGVYILSTVGSSADTKLAAYSGTALGALSLIASDDNSGGSGTSLITQHFDPGTYYIEVGSSTPGNLRFAYTLDTVDAGVAADSTIAYGSTVGVPDALVYKGRATAVQDSGSVA